LKHIILYTVSYCHFTHSHYTFVQTTTLVMFRSAHCSHFTQLGNLFTLHWLANKLTYKLLNKHIRTHKLSKQGTLKKILFIVTVAHGHCLLCTCPQGQPLQRTFIKVYCPVDADADVDGFTRFGTRRHCCCHRVVPGLCVGGCLCRSCPFRHCCHPRSR